MSRLVLLGAILLITNLVNANVNITCYECKGCTSMPTTLSTDNRFCLRIQMNCLVADIHIIDLAGDRLQSNYSLANCGQTRVYSSACTVVYQCCYRDKCNTYENRLPASSSSPSLFVLERIVISFHMLLIYPCFFQI